MGSENRDVSRRIRLRLCPAHPAPAPRTSRCRGRRSGERHVASPPFVLRSLLADPDTGGGAFAGALASCGKDAARWICRAAPECAPGSGVTLSCGASYLCFLVQTVALRLTPKAIGIARTDRGWRHAGRPPLSVQRVGRVGLPASGKEEDDDDHAHRLILANEAFRRITDVSRALFPGTSRCRGRRLSHPPPESHLLSPFPLPRSCHAGDACCGAQWLSRTGRPTPMPTLSSSCT